MGNFMMQLSALLKDYLPVTSHQDCTIQEITADSRQVTSNTAFFAFAGSTTDGRDYIEQALSQGAAAIIADTENSQAALETTTNPYGQTIPIVSLPHLQQQIGIIAANFFGNPTQKMQVIGYTGTSGKTSGVQLVAHALQHLGMACGTIGTLGYGFPGDELQVTNHATPSAIPLQRMLAKLYNQGAKAVAMEVSSHGIMQARISGIDFTVGVFTNLSHDHLDYHGNMENYAAAKRRFFTDFGLANAVFNLDDPYGQRWLSELKNTLNIYGYSTHTDYTSQHTLSLTATAIQLSLSGIQAEVNSPWGNSIIHSRLLGRFNLSNLLAVLAVLKALGIDWQQAVECISNLPTVAGRMDCFGGINQNGRQLPLVVVDYAHKPDALAQVLQVLREHCSGKLWCVFGCGGDRDRAKRPVMAAIAERFADRVIVTDDNPRTEDPQVITTEICQGFTNLKQVKVEHDRAKAITDAIQQAQGNDIVLIAGKGHEEYQIIVDRILPFSDIAWVKQVLAG
jgi:UDP-N-acetylmuramoyl-L-alanyl-D-glutamate--2,6-diaminopimelate ligase